MTLLTCLNSIFTHSSCELKWRLQISESFFCYFLYRFFSPSFREKVWIWMELLKTVSPKFRHLTNPLNYVIVPFLSPISRLLFLPTSMIFINAPLRNLKLGSCRGSRRAGHCLSIICRSGTRLVVNLSIVLRSLIIVVCFCLGRGRTIENCGSIPIGNCNSIRIRKSRQHILMLSCFGSFAFCVIIWFGRKRRLYS